MFSDIEVEFLEIVTRNHLKECQSELDRMKSRKEFSENALIELNEDIETTSDMTNTFRSIHEKLLKHANKCCTRCH